MKRCLALFTTIFIAINAITAQQFADTTFRQTAINNLTQFYYQAIGLQAHLYNGPLYDYYPRPFTDGQPFFQSDSSIAGSVTYDGLKYDNVLMNYDIIRDELIIFHPIGNYPLNLIKSKIDSFSLRSHSFIKITNNGSTTLPEAGFYDKLYASPRISFFVKRRKTIQEMTGLTSIETKVYAKTSYYIFKEGVYHIIKNKSSLFDLLKEEKNEIQRYSKKNKLKYKKNMEADILSTVKYYDQIMKTP